MNLVINLEKVKWCFNNIIKALCMARWVTHQTLINKTPFYLLKNNKRTKKKYISNTLLLTYLHL